jgi:tRNA threonylcarbamoyladenosine modification (KEOPS) complex Cgi121 subunit
METHEERVAIPADSQETSLAKTWTRKLDDQSFVFAAAFSLGGTFDLAPFTTALPEAVVVCDSNIVAGTEHIEQVLFQAHEYWKRDGELARKKSIDLLMRITCQRQISDAIVLSKIEKMNVCAIFGLVTSIDMIGKSLQVIVSNFPSAQRDDTLLDMGKRKTEFLRKVHRLPKTFKKSKVLVALKERSALLVFSN